MKSTIFLPGLNGVRFIAAFLVILDHLELFKSYFGYHTFWPNNYSSHLGSLGVTIFFVLSGFLITFLLTKEHNEGGINVRNFYIRRILRIWPLYYLLVLISFFIVPALDFLDAPIPYQQPISDNFIFKFSTFLFLLANVAFVYFPLIPYANVLWSVAVEEQFYLVWPLVIKKYARSLLPLFVLLALYMMIKLFALLYPDGTNWLPVPKLNLLLDRTRFSCMIIGAIGAVVVQTQSWILKRLVFKKVTQVISVGLMILILLNAIQIPHYWFIKNEFQSLVIIFILVNISINKYSIIKFENRIFDYLGKISYGLYVYHLFAVVIGIKLFSKLKLMESLLYPVWSILLLLFVLILTVCIAHFSYQYFEKFFLRLKQHYSTILSGNIAK